MSTDPCPTCATERARAEAAEARLATLLAPVEGVDLEEVLRLDREATPGPWEVATRCVRKIWAPNDIVEEPSGIVSGQFGQGVLWHGFEEAPDDATLIATYRTAAPALVHAAARARSMAHDYQALAADREGEIDRLKAALKFADERGAEAIVRDTRSIIADKWNSTAEAQAEVKRLTARLAEVEQERDEARADKAQP